MFTEADIASVDQANLYKIYCDWPDHFANAFKISAKSDHPSEYYDSILLCGMGGSATSCDIVGDLLRSYGKVPTNVLRGEQLPPRTNKRSLVLINSVSGNTKETITMMKQASDKGAEVICISSGGVLKDLATKRGHKHINIPNLLLPRASLPYMVIPQLKLIDEFLESSLTSELSSISLNLMKLRNEIAVSNLGKKNIARKVADFFESGFAFCLSSPRLLSVSTRFRNSLNENAKVHCLSQSILEASHNEIVPFTFKENTFHPKVLLLRWIQDQPIVRHRFNQMHYFFDSIGQPVIEMSVSQRSLTTALISAIYMLDFATIYMAVSRKVDPSRTPAIDILKSLDNRTGNRRIPAVNVFKTI